MDWSEHSDEALCDAVLAGNRRAFEPLYDRHARAVYNYFLRCGRQPALAEDLAHDTFLRVLGGLPDWKREAKFTTWLFSIARNLFVDHTRRQVHRRHQSLDVPNGSNEGAPMVERVPNGALSPDRSAASRTMGDDIARALEALPDDQREVFILREVSGLRFQDIAELLGISENTVKSRMRYALERLREQLQSHRPTPAPQLQGRGAS